LQLANDTPDLEMLETMQIIGLGGNIYPGVGNVTLKKLTSSCSRLFDYI